MELSAEMDEKVVERLAAGSSLQLRFHSIVISDSLHAKSRHSSDIPWIIQHRQHVTRPEHEPLINSPPLQKQ